jgi:thioredoxin-like negative regulator of GroEL
VFKNYVKFCKDSEEELYYLQKALAVDPSDIELGLKICEIKLVDGRSDEVYQDLLKYLSMSLSPEQESRVYGKIIQVLYN